MKKVCFLLFSTTLLFACNQPASTADAANDFNLDSVKAAIDANNHHFSEAVVKGDSALFVSGYTKDGCVMPDGGAPKMCGAEGLSQFLAMAKGLGVADIKLSTVEVIGGKELVSEEGTYVVLAADGSTIDKGKFLVTWKQENGTWKKYRDIWNTDTPPPPAKK